MLIGWKRFLSGQIKKYPINRGTIESKILANIRIERCLSPKPGGQNKLTENPRSACNGFLNVECCQTRSAIQNQEIAMEKLNSIIDKAFYVPPPIPEATLEERRKK
ncbi:hypothetical protein RF11_00014 [Thelohanellus kitauei]|uniref:Uncharacterized protein n=1 Tax=Thelohanellus kitauei TaxID=669202 RepID=A0A0C2NCL6_THEKT|nr:hypothetical protein RF11_00014 [Thelohanellus kitauei]